MSTAEFLAQLRGLGIEIRAEGEELRCSAPAGALTIGLRDELCRRKAELVEFVRSARALASQQRAIVPLQPHGHRVPVFGVPGHNGDVFCYRALAQALGEEQPFYGLQPPGAGGREPLLETVDELAAYFTAQIRAFRMEGPVIVAGFCAGGTIAFELGRRLAAAGSAVDFIALFGSPYPSYFGFVAQVRQRLVNAALSLKRHFHALRSLPCREGLRYVSAELRSRKLSEQPQQDPALLLRAKVERATLAAVRRHSPAEFAGRLVLLLPSRSWAPSNLALRWRSAARRVEEYYGPEGCNNDNMLRPPHAPIFAELFRHARDSASHGINATAGAYATLNCSTRPTMSAP